MYESGLITPEGEIIHIPYYEIGKYIENVVIKYIDENLDNKELFELFKQGYNYFSPYFDFAIMCLGYKMINPLVVEQSTLYAKDGEMVNKPNNLLPESHYDRVTDFNYHIGKVNTDNLRDCVLSGDLIQFEVNRDKKRYHQDVYEIILIEKMIYNEILYKDFLLCMTNPKYKNIYPNIDCYFRGRLGFAHVVVYEDKSGYIIYNKDLKSKHLDSFLFELKSSYPQIDPENDVENLSYFFSEEEIKKILEFKQEIGEINECRRIQF